MITQYGSTNDPPQNWLPYRNSITCHGQLFMIATVPPTMRIELGRVPQNTKDRKGEDVIVYHGRCNICGLFKAAVRT